MSPIKVLFVEYCDYVNVPVGGQLSFIRTLLAKIEVDAHLAGITARQEPLSQWTMKDVSGRYRQFFAFDRFSTVGLTSYVPRRILFLLNVFKTGFQSSAI